MAGTIQGALKDGFPRAGWHLRAPERGNGPLARARAFGGRLGRLAGGIFYRRFSLGLRTQAEDNAGVRARGGREQANNPTLCPVGGLIHLRRLGDFSISVDRDGHTSEVGIEILVKRRKFFWA